jgi:hypothetical protein
MTLSLWTRLPDLLRIAAQPSSDTDPAADSAEPSDDTGEDSYVAFAGDEPKSDDPNPVWASARRFLKAAGDYWDEVGFSHRVSSVVGNHLAMKRFEGAEEGQQVWDAALDRLEEDGIDFPRDEVSTYEDYLSYLAKNGIRFPERIKSLKTAFTIAGNKARLADPDRATELGVERPIAVVIGPKTDWNQAFTARHGFPLLDTLVEDGSFDVIYIESGSDREAAQALKMVKLQTGSRIHTAIIGGHGTRQSIQLGADGGTDDNTLDVQDLEEDRLFDGMDDVMEEGGQIILWSCSNGAPLQPEEEEDDDWNPWRLEGPIWAPVERKRPPPVQVTEQNRYNMAEAVSRAVPERAVIAVQVPSNIRSLTIDSGTHTATVGWWKGSKTFIGWTSREDYDERAVKRRAAWETSLAGQMFTSLRKVAQSKADAGCDPNQSCNP